jgi:hypothetical protein
MIVEPLEGANSIWDLKPDDLRAVFDRLVELKSRLVELAFEDDSF